MKLQKNLNSGGLKLMDDKKTRLKDDSIEFNPEKDAENEGLIDSLKNNMKEHQKKHQNHHEHKKLLKEAYREQKELFKNLPKYDRKLLKGIMRGPGKIMILWLIGKGRAHGYDLMNKIQGDMPAGHAKTSSPGKIYPILHELEKNGLVEGTWEYHGKRKLKFYEITQEGVNTLLRIRDINKCRGKNTKLLEEFMSEMFFQDRDLKFENND